MLSKEEITLLIADGLNGNVSVKLLYDLNYHFWQVKYVAFNYPDLSQMMDSRILYFHYCYLSLSNVVIL